MNNKQTAILISAFLNLILTQTAIGAQCPRECSHPRSEYECQLCLNEGYSDIVLNRDGSPWIWYSLPSLQPGAWSEWSDDRCWIHLKGFASDECRTLGTSIFERCSGYDSMEYNYLTGRCWVKYRRV